MKKIILILSMLVLGTTFLTAQTVEVMPYGVTPREAVSDTNDIFDVAYNAQLNVGKETVMYLKGMADTALVGTWAVASAPSGSAATIGTKVDGDDNSIITFTPDLVGTFKIEYTVNGVTASITINSGLYLGVTGGNCTVCHSGVGAEWEGTGHATANDRKLTGNPSYYREYCISCHSTGYDKNADNDGFDDFDFVWPDSLHAGTPDLLYAAYPDAMARSNIQCEACHGPGSEHNGNIADNRMAISWDPNVCAKCHDSGTHHVYPAQWDISGHANPPARATWSGSCARCHTAEGFAQFAAGDKVSSFPGGGQISCAGCHDPHNATNDHQLRTMSATLLNGFEITDGGRGKLCMNCHQGRRDADSYTESARGHYGPHYMTQADVINAENAVTFGWDLPSSPHVQAVENSCVTCHMAPGHVDEDKNVILTGSHSFQVVFPNGDHNVAICEDCHGDVGTTFDEKKFYFNGMADHDGDGTAEGLTAEVEGLMEELASLLPAADGHDAYDPHDDVAGFTKVQLKAAFNYEIVYYDRSHGIHNPAFTVALLKVSIEALKYGALTSGDMVAVNDIPMDQGNQVRVVWTAFGADDGVSRDKVKSYTVLREIMGAAPKTAKNYTDVKQLPVDITKGDQVMLDGHLWDVVAEVEAIQFLEYAAVVPTLKNTVPGDTAWTSFKVVGKTEAGFVAETTPMAGYSTDDLAPVVPTGVVGSVLGNSVLVKWDDPVDEDFQYFKVYRSTESGFNHVGMEPYRKTTKKQIIDNNIEKDVEYFYVVTATDFNMNEGVASSQVSAMVVGIEDETGIPTKFSLSQNYPNPFNPTTQVKFGVPSANNVKVTIYNSVGMKVAELVNDYREAGYHTVTWNASGVATGVYFCEMISGDFKQVNKMLLIK